MGRRHCWVACVLLGGSALVLFGCASGGDNPGLMVQHTANRPDADDPLLSPALPPEPARVSRAQRPDGPEPVRPASTNASRNVTAAVPPVHGELRVSVRAWVNEKPIFDEEVRTALLPFLAELQRLPEPERTNKMVDLFKQELEHIIDRELVMQDVTHKLEKNGKMMEKLTSSAHKEFEKQILIMEKRSGAKTERDLKDQLQRQGTSLDSIRRQFERNFITKQYMMSRIGPFMDGVDHQMILEYYQQHLNEFQTVDSVKWQDLFIAKGPKHRTLADARAFGEQLVLRLRRGEDFKKLADFDDGDSRLRNGDGYGQRRGEIKPPELEPYLFRMHDGDIGPVVELSTGVHVFRLVKREYTGQMPFSVTVQSNIRTKLKNEIADREAKRILKELRSKAIIEYMRDTPR